MNSQLFYDEQLAFNGSYVQGKVSVSGHPHTLCLLPIGEESQRGDDSRTEQAYIEIGNKAWQELRSVTTCSQGQEAVS